MELYFAFLLYFQCRVHVYWDLRETAVLSCYWRSLSSGFGVSLCAPPFIATCDTHARCLLRFESFHHFVLCGYLLPRFESSWVESLMPCCLSREPVFELRQFFSLAMLVRVFAALFLCCLRTHRPQYHSSVESFF